MLLSGEMFHCAFISWSLCLPAVMWRCVSWRELLEWNTMLKSQAGQLDNKWKSLHKADTAADLGDCLLTCLPSFKFILLIKCVGGYLTWVDEFGFRELLLPTCSDSFSVGELFLPPLSLSGSCFRTFSSSALHLNLAPFQSWLPFSGAKVLLPVCLFHWP